MENSKGKRLIKHPFAGLREAILELQREIAEMTSKPQKYSVKEIESKKGTLGLYLHLSKCRFHEEEGKSRGCRV